VAFHGSWSRDVHVWAGLVTKLHQLLTCRALLGRVPRHEVRRGTPGVSLAGNGSARGGAGGTSDGTGRRRSAGDSSDRT